MGKAEIDAKRCQVNLKAMSAMGYDAIALSQTDISYGNTYLSQQYAVATFPFLASTQKDFTQPFVIKRVGRHNIAFVADGACDEQIISQAKSHRGFRQSRSV